jgi:hypothetical protein
MVFADTRYQKALVFAVCVLFVLLFLTADWHAVTHAGGDTSAYVEAARLPGFWAGKRPPLYPLLMRFTKFDFGRIVTIQIILYLAAWITLAFALRRIWLAAIALAMGLYPGFAAWTGVVLTEAPAIALIVFSFVCLLALLDGRRTALWPFIALLVAGCFLRSFDCVLFLLMMPLPLCLAAQRRLSWAAAAAFCAVAAGCYVIVAIPDGGPHEIPWRYAFLDTIGQRILPDPVMRACYTAHGMPQLAALEPLAGHDAYFENFHFVDDQAFAPMHDWIRAHGTATQLACLVRHPEHLVTLFRANLDPLFQAGGLTLPFYFDPGYKLTFPPLPPLGVVYTALALAALAGTARLRRHEDRPICLLLTLSLAPMAAAIVVADSNDVGRHAMPLWLFSCLCLILWLRTIGAQTEPR